jgi:hypothetical protein
MNILNTLKSIKKLHGGGRGAAEGGGSTRALHKRSSAPHMATNSTVQARPARTKTLGETPPSAAPGDTSIKRRPSANPFSSPPPAPPQSRQFAGGGLNPFGEDDDDTSDDEPPSNPSLNPFRSSFESSASPPQRASAASMSSASADTNQLVDDFINLSENGIVTFDKLCGWEEIKLAVDAGDITVTDISLLWAEVGAGKGLDQERFIDLVNKIEKLLA